MILCNFGGSKAQEKAWFLLDPYMWHWGHQVGTMWRQMGSDFQSDCPFP